MKKITGKIADKIRSLVVTVKQLKNDVRNIFNLHQETQNPLLPSTQNESAPYNCAIRYGVKTLIVFAIIFLGWGLLAPIKSASIAEGTIVLDFSRKTIQHLEGGMIDQILVKEGQMVKENDVLLYLHDIQVKTEQQILKERLWTMEVQKERLRAEKNNKQEMDLTNFLAKNNNQSENDQEKIQEIIDTQDRLFEARKQKRSGEINVLKTKLKSSKIRLKFLRKELNLTKPLVAEENLSLLREFELQKSIAELDYEVQSTKLQIANFKNEDLSEILKEANETNMEIVGLFNQLSASKDILKRSAIQSPVTGKVMNIKYHTIGAVVPAGGEMMNIVPQNEELIIEAKIRPIDIDNIVIGMKTKVSLTAYQGKKVPKMNGKVINVAADITTNEQTGESYFLGRISINKDDIEKLKHKVVLYPGMPAQVFILTGSRSLVSYLFSPISDSTYKAFREE
ncbi:MAG: HlyD family type I secretion membrane fusion protein [Rickettsiales bacterium]|jgi:HlyD family type I secretion membrane fusion protein